MEVAMRCHFTRHDPDPFNHGRYSIDFRQPTIAESELLNYCLHEGWGLKPKSAKVFVRNEAYSKTFCIETPLDQYVFQISSLNTAAEQRINDLCLVHSIENGLPVPRRIKLKNGALYFSFKDNFCSLNQYIQGRHFSGTRSELILSAKYLAKFHKIFQNFPQIQTVIDIKGEVYKFDIDQWNNLKEKIPKIKQSKFDLLAKEAVDAITERILLLETVGLNLPRCIGHFDWHPHNLIFNSEQNLIGILDFDLVRFSRRCADVALAMHKLSRIFGQKTEKKADLGATLNDRCKIFLEAYTLTIALSEDEISAMIGCLYDEVRRKILYILSKFYDHGDSSSNFDLSKQVTQLYELDVLNLQ